MPDRPSAYSVDASAGEVRLIRGGVGMAVDDLPLAVLTAVGVGDARVYGSSGVPSQDTEVCS